MATTKTKTKVKTMQSTPHEDRYLSEEYVEETTDPEREVLKRPQQQTKQRRRTQQNAYPQSLETYGRAVQPFERAGPPATASTSMDGPVTKARAMRGELDLQQPNVNAGQEVQVQPAAEKDDETGLKLRLDLNLDIEVELKAKIHGDLTLSLLS